MAPKPSRTVAAGTNRTAAPVAPALTPETTDTTAGRCRGQLEVEAESVAYLVASTHGLDTGAYTFAYVAGWAGEVDGARIDGGRVEQVVRGTAHRVLTAAKDVLAGTQLARGCSIRSNG